MSFFVVYAGGEAGEKKRRGGVDRGISRQC